MSQARSADWMAFVPLGAVGEGSSARIRGRSGATLVVSRGPCVRASSRRRCGVPLRMQVDGMEVQIERSDELCVMVNGVPGPMATEVARAVLRRKLPLVPFALTGPSVAQHEASIDGSSEVKLVKPDAARSVLKQIKAARPNVVCVDYTHPSSANANASLYAECGVCYVMGTTGGDADAMRREVADKAGMFAVVAPNMAKQIVAFQAAMKIMAEQFPGAFEGYTLTVVESHQSTKADTSGTAKAVVASFKQLGLDFDVDQIEKVRDPEQSISRMRVPADAVSSGHAFHTYHLSSPDGSVHFEFQHNVAGRRVYAEGTVDAVQFLDRQRGSGSASQTVFDMIDVLRSGSMKS
ncbi:putative 4-hydroxy-tetrahydrodipicolinate reductase 2, chloroplastic [Porphyridium purpureum]|uniref:4-hydroxy-tetrahydrodipicolinate reductase n=1 Tax=Porphyridium purpureum TaxID=35688 RepID=A0A5J4YZ32_PORPP|nr:putative 4-hydroxy-tetrahydrodipicolinate reductase 2, chloroplastic [Porphyridium purpureum]|eukprot:POR1471..scf208_2